MKKMIVTALCLLLMLSLAACSANEQKAAEEESALLTDEFLKGTWVIDGSTNSYNEVDVRTRFGSMFSMFAPNLNFGDNGAFSYYIGAYGGEGSYQIAEGQITYTITDQNEGTPESSVIWPEEVEGKSCLVQQLDFGPESYYLVWSR